MSSALEMFKQQKAAVEELLAITRGLQASIAGARKELDTISRHDGLRSILTEEQRWLARTEDAVRTVRAWREHERRAYWPLLAWRWAVAVTFALLVSIADGAGYVGASTVESCALHFARLTTPEARAITRGVPEDERHTPSIQKRRLGSRCPCPCCGHLTGCAASVSADALRYRLGQTHSAGPKRSNARCSRG